MTICQTATYRVKPEAVDKVKRAITEFVLYVRANEPGTRMYIAWQQQDDPTRFIHLFVFEDDAAQTIHSESAAVKRFESIYAPELVGGDESLPTSTWWQPTNVDPPGLRLTAKRKILSIPCRFDHPKGRRQEWGQVLNPSAALILWPG